MKNWSSPGTNPVGLYKHCVLRCRQRPPYSKRKLYNAHGEKREEVRGNLWDSRAVHRGWTALRSTWTESRGQARSDGSRPLTCRQCAHAYFCVLCRAEISTSPAIVLPYLLDSRLVFFFGEGEPSAAEKISVLVFNYVNGDACFRKLSAKSF